MRSGSGCKKNHGKFVKILENQINNPREWACFQWVNEVLPAPMTEWKMLAGDASFRRYFRTATHAMSYVVMDAPPEKESSLTPFITIDQTLEKMGLMVPHIFAQEVSQGFLLLSDLGDDLFSAHLTDHSVEKIYDTALHDLRRMQECQKISGYDLPEFDRIRYLMEMRMIEEWYVGHHLQRKLSESEQKILENAFELLIQNACEQPQVFVHRDYHSRNLLLVPEMMNGAVIARNAVRKQSRIHDWITSDAHVVRPRDDASCHVKTGILDFQDAVWGPVTYDLMSLVRDCYIDWPVPSVEKWIENFRLKLAERDAVLFSDATVFLKWSDWMGLQRHLKCIGLFARLHYRDHKSNYMQYWPRLFRYVEHVCSKYTALHELGQLMRCLAQENHQLAEKKENVSA